MQYFTIPMMRTGRILFAAHQIKAALPADAPDALVAQLDATIEQATAHRATETAWDNRDTGTARGDAAAHDRDADEVIAQIAAVCRSLAPLGDANAMGKAANALLTRFFPRGVGKVTQLIYEEEIAWIDDFLAAVSEGEPAAWIAALPLDDFIARLRVIAPAYRAELEKGREALTHADVVDGRRATRDAVQDLIASVWVYSTDDSARDALLEPLAFQINSHRSHRRGRRNVASDVDPNTGEEIVINSDDVEAEAPADPVL